MENKWKDILSGLNKDVEQDKLLEYLHRELSPEEQHAVEEGITDDPFASDALEGLSQLKDKQHLDQIISQLNQGMKSQLQRNPRRKRRDRMDKTPWTLVAIICLLVLSVLAYMVIHFLLK